MSRAAAAIGLAVRSLSFRRAHLQQVTNFCVIVDDLANSSDQADHLLGHVVCGCRLAAKDTDAGHELLALLGAGRLDLQVAVDDGEHVEMLALVLVDALDLDVKHGIGGHIHANIGLHAHDVMSASKL